MENIENIRLSYPQACSLQKDQGAIIIDVRTKEEHQRECFPETDLHIDLYTDFAENIADLKKGKIYICYCMSGGRSQSAAAIMREHGYTAVDIVGGIMNSL